MDIKEAIEILKDNTKSRKVLDKELGEENKLTIAMEVITSFLSTFQSAEMPKKKEELTIDIANICLGHKERTGTWVTNGICNDCGFPVNRRNLYNWGYNQCHDDFLAFYLKKMGERVDVEKIWNIICDYFKEKIFNDKKFMTKVTYPELKDLARAITKEIKE